MGTKHLAPFNPQTFLTQIGSGKTTLTSTKKQILFSQGDAADAVFYIQAGKVTLTVVSPQGKEAVVAMLEPGGFFGEGCLAGQLVCMATATADKGSTLARIDKQAMIRVLHDEPTFSTLFLTYLLARNMRIKRTWWINSSIPARSVWRGCCCSWPTLGKKARRRRSFRRSARKRWPR